MAKKTASKKPVKQTVAKTGESTPSADPVFEYKLEKGVDRPFVVTTPPTNISDVRSPTSTKEQLLLIGLAVFAFTVRLNQLSYPNSVVFDEVHFGGFARKYVLGNYFMDVHPPLAKMLYAAVGYTLGFNGDFEFKNIGDVYPETTPYVGMRAFPAILGVGTVILSYLTLRASGCRIITSLLTAVLLTIENSNTTISRYILLDSPLIFFIAGSAYALKKFETELPFTAKWYKTLIIAGACLGCAVASKWVGLFTIFWAGCYMIWQMWFILGDLSLSPKQVGHHFFARGILLLGIPAIIYCVSFAIHFQLLQNEGDGSAFMSSAFRSTLTGNTIPKVTNARVGVKSDVTIRHITTQGGYLHSHDHLYETGSKQQQITLYPHLDDNNIWEIELYNVSEPPTEFIPITDGTKIRLKHKSTFRRLHSHNLRPPMSEQDWQNEASCYGFEGFEGDANDDFIVEIDKPKSKKGAARKELHAIDTVFRLRHAMTGCYLFSHEVKLPKYAFEQQEVTCASQGIRPLSLWYIEVNNNEFLDENAEKVSYKKLTFWDKLFESHARMWHINNGLTASHNWESRPPSWPLLQRGINYWVKDNHQVYFIGNAVTWWASSVIIFVYICNVAAVAINWQRGKPLITDPSFINFNVQTLIYVGGWAAHYFPSFIMGRQLFLHHYLPAFYFQVLALGQTFDLILTFFAKKRQVVAHVIFVSFLVSAGLFFVHYSPLIWGGDWTKSQCNSSKLLETWDFDCNAFHDSYADYSILSSPAPTGEVFTDPSVNYPPSGAEANNEQIIQEANTIKDSIIEDIAPGSRVIRKYQDEFGNPVDAEIAEAYIREHPEEILKVETQVNPGP